MDSTTFRLQSSKVDKAHVKLRNKEKLYNMLLHFLRVLEMGLFFIFIWRNAPRFPVSLTECNFHELFMILSSPPTVFLIGNAIILILFFVESRQHHDHNVSKSIVTTDEFVEIKSKMQQVDDSCDKEVKKKMMIKVDDQYADDSQKKQKIYKRSKSETWQKMVGKQRRGEFRRSATGTANERWRNVDCGMGMMNDDEFRGKVEAFIAKQQTNLRQGQSHD